MSPSAIGAVVTPQFETSIVACYSEAIREELKNRGGDIVTIINRLGKHKSTRSRWRRKMTNPDWKTQCLAMAAFDADMGPRLPKGRAVVRSAIATTLPVIVEQWTKKAANGSLTADDIVVLHYAGGSSSWRSAATAKDERKLTRAADSIFAKVEREGVACADRSYQRVAILLQNWHTAWCLFHKSIVYQWTYWS